MNASATAKAEHVTIRFGSLVAVHDVSLEVYAGEVFGMLGPNGSGKTTFIRGLCGLIPITEGRAILLNRDVATEAEEVRRSVGYMSQKFSLYADLTGDENISFYSGVYGLSSAQAADRREELIELTGLGPHLKKRSAKLSGGWKQRLALVCALIHSPQIVFLDEPTAGVDPVARRDLWDLLFRLSADGITLFVTTHYMDEAERCGRVAYLYLGDMLALGTPEQLQSHPDVTPPGSARFEVESPGEDVSQLLDRLKRHPQVREATIFGRSVRALVDRDFRWDEVGDGNLRVEMTEPNLEDVFVSLSRARSGG